jgi:hypothetical protein
MPAKTNTILSTDYDSVRAVDFATRFEQGISILTDLFPNIRMSERKPGEQLYSRRASVTLNNAPVGEGEEIPYNKVDFYNVPVGEVVLDKQIVAPTLETVLKNGYGEIQRADDDQLFKMTNKIATRLVNFMGTGALTSGYSTVDFASAVSEGIGLASSWWENANLGYSEFVGFCNTQDMFRYFGANPPSTQRDFGLDYIKDYNGISKLFYSSKIPQGKVYVTPGENIIMDYVNFRNPDVEKMGFNFTTTGERNLIGVRINPVGNRLVSELLAVTGVGVRAEYLDGIANVDIGTVTITEVENPTGNPSALGYYEKGAGDTYIKTTDTTVQSGKTYYTRTVTAGA